MPETQPAIVDEKGVTAQVLAQYDELNRMTALCLEKAEKGDGLYAIAYAALMLGEELSNMTWEFGRLADAASGAGCDACERGTAAADLVN